MVLSKGSLGLCSDLDNSTMVHPRIRVVPMGWSHALDLAQRAFENIVCKALSVPRSRLLCDGVKPCNVAIGVPAVYVDNFVFVSNSVEESHKALSLVKDECTWYQAQY